MRGTDDQWEPVDAPRSRGAAVTMLFHLHYRRLVSLADLLVGDPGTAEEVVQDAFESLYRRWGSLRDPSSAVAYLDRSVVYGSRSRIRRRYTERSFRSPKRELSRPPRVRAWTTGRAMTCSPPSISSRSASAKSSCCATTSTSPRTRSPDGWASARLGEEARQPSHRHPAEADGGLGMNEFAEALSATLHERAQETAMSIDMPQAERQLQESIRSADRRRRVWVAAAAAAAFLIAVAGIAFAFNRPTAQPAQPKPSHANRRAPAPVPADASQLIPPLTAQLPYSVANADDTSADP